MTRKTLFCLLLALLMLLSACGKKEEAPSSEGIPESQSAAASETEPASEASTGFFLSLSEEYALGMLTKSLPENTPYTIDTLDFSAPNITTVTGDVNLRLLAEQYEFLSVVSAFLPTGISFSSSCSFEYSEEAGFTITPVGLEVTGFTIPTDILPASLYNYYAGALNDYIKSLPVPITSVTMTDDAINIAG